MSTTHQRTTHLFALLLLTFGTIVLAPAAEHPFPGYPNLEKKSTGEWWKIKNRNLDVPRQDVVAFALYTHDRGVLKLSAQLYPLKPSESREVRLEFWQDDAWQIVAKQPVIELGWSAHFRVESWDNTKAVRYRVSHGEAAHFEGLIRKDPNRQARDCGRQSVVQLLPHTRTTSEDDREP